MRRIKGIRKKLTQISKLEKEKDKELTVEQKAKIQRKSSLSDELRELDAWLALSPDLVAEEKTKKSQRKEGSVATRSSTKEYQRKAVFTYRKDQDQQIAYQELVIAFRTSRLNQN